jgi:hypothetical protein
MAGGQDAMIEDQFISSAAGNTDRVEYREDFPERSGNRVIASGPGPRA